MSPKSRPPKGKKKKGKKGAEEDLGPGVMVVQVDAPGPPFGLVVLIALVLSLAPLMQFVEGSMPFDGAVLRFLAALAVSWILLNLVYAVASSFSPSQDDAAARTLDAGHVGGAYVPDPAAHYRTTPVGSDVEAAR